MLPNVLDMSYPYPVSLVVTSWVRTSHCTLYKKLTRKRNFCGGCGPSETPNSCSPFKGGGVPAGFFWKIKYDIFYDMA